jgi:hypothetical protein
MQIAGLRAQAAFKSCGAAEQGIPLSCTQPGGGGGHGLPSGVTHDGHTGAAWTGAANATARTAAAVMMASFMAHSLTGQQALIAAVAVMRAFMAVLQFCSAAVSIFTSACCTSHLARGNAQEQTHSETSSNCLCANDE